MKKLVLFASFLLIFNAQFVSRAPAADKAGKTKTVVKESPDVPVPAKTVKPVPSVKKQPTVKPKPSPTVPQPVRPSKGKGAGKMIGDTGIHAGGKGASKAIGDTGLDTRGHGASKAIGDTGIDIGNKGAGKAIGDTGLDTRGHGASKAIGDTGLDTKGHGASKVIGDSGLEHRAAVKDAFGGRKGGLERVAFGRLGVRAVDLSDPTNPDIDIEGSFEQEEGDSGTDLVGRRVDSPRFPAIMDAYYESLKGSPLVWDASAWDALVGTGDSGDEVIDALSARKGANESRAIGSSGATYTEEADADLAPIPDLDPLGDGHTHVSPGGMQAEHGGGMDDDDPKDTILNPTDP